MICNSCGQQNPDDDVYCRRCGSQIQTQRGRVEQEMRRKAIENARAELEEKTRALLITAAFVFVVALGIRLLFGSGNWPRTPVLPSSIQNSPRATRFQPYGSERFIEENSLKPLPLPSED